MAEISFTYSFLKVTSYHKQIHMGSNSIWRLLYELLF